MEIDRVPAAVQARLGAGATTGLLQLLERSNREVREAMTTACTERFERRLVAEVSGLRVQIAQVEATLRGDMAAGRVEFINWSFLFWTGQVLAITGILAVMLRFVRP